MQVYNKNQLHYSYGKIFTESQACDYLESLQKEVVYLSGDFAKIKIYGKLYDIPRSHVAFGDPDLKYSFSGTTIQALPWTPLLLEIKAAVELVCQETFNFVLINQYRSGQDCIGFHKDDEKDMVINSSIASISLGQQRDFVFKRNGFSPITIPLESGSLLRMLPPTNESWYHGLPRRKNVCHVRLNLTFRKMKSSPNQFVCQSMTPPHHTMPSLLSNDKDKNCCTPTTMSSVCSQPSLASLPACTMKRSSAPTYSSAKKACVSDSLLPALDSPPGIKLDQLPPFHYFLGEEMFVKVTDFTGSIRVHIRKYRQETNGYFPTKFGLTMSACTFKFFMNNIYRMTTMEDIIVLNKELFISRAPSSSSGCVYTFQQLFSTPHGHELNRMSTTLTFSQLEELEKVCNLIWTHIVDLTFGPVFKDTVLQICGTSQEKKEIIHNHELTNILTEVVKCAMEENLDKFLQCSECLKPVEQWCANQLGHNCLTTTHEEKWKSFFEKSFGLLNPKVLARAFAKDCVDFIVTSDFLDAIQPQKMLESIA